MDVGVKEVGGDSQYVAWHSLSKLKTKGRAVDVSECLLARGLDVLDDLDVLLRTLK